MSESILRRAPRESQRFSREFATSHGTVMPAQSAIFAKVARSSAEHDLLAGSPPYYLKA
jgi:hypothetical protein